MSDFTSLDNALDSAMKLMEEARASHIENAPCGNSECELCECQHLNLKHTDSSAHTAFCPDCEFEMNCLCDDPNN